MSKISSVEQEYFRNQSEIQVLKLRNRRPLQLPLFVDPRRMNRRELLVELGNYGNDISLYGDASKAVMVAMVYDALIAKGKIYPLEPLEMDDKQPEKWYLIAEQLHIYFCYLENDPAKRQSLMDDANKLLRNKNIEELVDLANSAFLPVCSGTASSVVIRFVAALMLEPHFEREAELKCGCKGLIRASVAIAGNYNGYTRLPEHLSTRAAEAATTTSGMGAKRKKRSAEITVQSEDVDGCIHRVVINEDVFVQVGIDRRVRARVKGVEGADGEDGIEVIAVPVNVQDLGSHFEFKLTIQEYQEAREQALEGGVKHVEI